MKKVILCFSLLLFFSSFIPDTGERFFSALARHSSEVKTVSGTFEQLKQIKVLDQSVSSSGNFYYSRPGNVRFDYTSPKVMSIIMTPSNIHILSSKSSSTFSLEKQKGLADLAKVMEACMGGDFNSIPNSYKVAYYKGEKGHHLVIEPKIKSRNNPYNKIELRLSEEDYSIEELALHERSDDVTTYKFRGISTNKRFASTFFKP
ncbi:MAG: outer membrane lipoprotein carrier protein LolA [Bacteroidales bacterium]|jgi:outer membrane lipoprotein-sorting protein|nr:outer membrane lipoprotein carrier protein LolA [Bacteroidales bacterium]